MGKGIEYLTNIKNIQEFLLFLKGRSCNLTIYSLLNIQLHEKTCFFLWNTGYQKWVQKSTVVERHPGVLGIRVFLPPAAAQPHLVDGDIEALGAAEELGDLVRPLGLFG